MDTIKKVLHPKETTHKTDNTDHSTLPADAHPDQQTLDRIGNEPNVTGTSRPPPKEDFPASTATGDQPKINRGHHHPRQPVGATGPPPGHGGAASAAADAGTHDIRRQAEADNNFPGTNPNPAHSA
ncbi:hypothetical protein J7T55_006191 [Diaporthe amygdali]|uniref:uncharacterized protein n=1 Tax=Phomopsis amygdali TaxID=1214568 RepID=UPI0022FF36A2|nr:uncharacterized protein J7T55_006191 [Diaporthe amygdali]KAJ0124848.1 hypothetical protein J7T55_006191 [Diaporthe amygdali]